MFDEIGVFLRGIVLGVMVAAPVGPVGLLCIRKTIQKGLFIGFATGFGAAFADAFFSAVAAFGVASVTEALERFRSPIHVIGGLFLLVVAWHTWHDKPKQADTKAVEKMYLQRAHLKVGGALKAMLTSFIITMSNPATVFGVLALVATFGGLQSRVEAGAIIAGIFCGSSLWWLILSGGVFLVRRRFTDNGVVLINRGTSVVLAGFGLWVFAVGVLKLMGYDVPTL